MQDKKASKDLKDQKVIEVLEDTEGRKVIQETMEEMVIQDDQALQVRIGAKGHIFLRFNTTYTITYYIGPKGSKGDPGQVPPSRPGQVLPALAHQLIKMI